jgi:hypothetical protein
MCYWLILYVDPNKTTFQSIQSESINSFIFICWIMKRSNIYDLDHLISNRVKTSAFCIMEEQRKHDLIVFSSYSSHQFDLKKKKKTNIHSQTFSSLYVLCHGFFSFVVN